MKLPGKDLLRQTWGPQASASLRGPSKASRSLSASSMRVQTWENAASSQRCRPPSHCRILLQIHFIGLLKVTLLDLWRTLQSLPLREPRARRAPTGCADNSEPVKPLLPLLCQLLDNLQRGLDTWLLSVEA